MTDHADLISRLRSMLHNETIKDRFYAIADASDAIELLQRELKCANELWEQQKELALEYLADIEKAHKRIEKANERIAELEAALQAICGTSFCARNDMDLNFVSRSAVDAARKLLGEKE